MRNRKMTKRRVQKNAMIPVKILYVRNGSMLDTLSMALAMGEPKRPGTMLTMSNENAYGYFSTPTTTTVIGLPIK